jgi:hypothetical protein
MRKEIEVAIAKRRRAKLPKFAARVARWYLRAYDNFSYDTAANGEAFVIARVAEAGGRVFFDVGANVGDWTPLALDAGGKVHAFEIVPTTAEECERRFGKHATVNRVGLLDRAGE